MGGWTGELRYAARMLVKQPGVSGLAVIALGLGIGLTAVMFSIVYGALLRGLPFENGDRIISVSRANPSRDIDQMDVPLHDYLDWRERQTSFEALAGMYEGTVNVRWADEPERFDGAFVTANFFSALGVQPRLGRAFTEDEDEAGAPATLIISHRVWMERFGGEPGALGQAVKVNGEPARIIGVMPEGFRFPSTQDVWVPLRVDALELPRDGGVWLSVFGPLAAGTSIEGAMTEFSGIAARLALAYPDTNEGVIPRMRPFTLEYLGEEVAGLLYTMLAAVSLVLLIACANVANLLLARGAQRTREIGVRTALGARRARVIGQMVSEALAIAAVAAALGTLIAWAGIGLFERAIAPTDPPYFLVFQVDAPILAFIVLSAVLAAVLAGGIPAIKASGMDVTAVLKDEARGSSSLRIGRLSRALVVGEIAMSVGLLVAAGLMIKSVATLRNFDYGFDPDAVFTARLALFEAEFPDTAQRRALYRDLEARLRALPGVRYAALGNVLPGQGTGTTAIALEGRVYAEERDHPSVHSALVSPGYFATTGVEIAQGRDFNALDDAAALPVAIINVSFADEHLAGQDPLGRRFRVGLDAEPGPWLTVVGVVPDLQMQGMGNTEGESAGFYWPLAQGDARFMSLLARGPADPMSLTEAVRRAVTSLSPDTPIYFVDTLTERLAEDTWFYGVFGALFMVFGGAALLLASVGLYGVMAFSVARRTAEVGIRMALGASRSDVLSLILRQGLAQIAVGLAIGLGLALLVARGLRLVLFEVSPNDPAVFVAVSAVLALTGVVASLVPARRATRFDPSAALRYD